MSTNVALPLSRTDCVIVVAATTGVCLRTVPAAPGRYGQNIDVEGLFPVQLMPEGTKVQFFSYRGTCPSRRLLEFDNGHSPQH